MDETGIIKFLGELDIDQDSITIREGWVNSVCPLAPYLHGSGEDRHPSFGISINPNSYSYYYCFGCTPYGRRLDALLHNLFVASGRYPMEAAKVYSMYEVWDGDPVQSIADTKWRKDPVLVESLPGKVLAKFPKLVNQTDYEARKCSEFLRSRGIPKWVQLYFGVRYSREWGSLVFPLTDRRGHIYLLRMRSRKRKKILSVSPVIAGFPDMKFPRLKHSGAWFGMHQVDWRKPVLPVEGEIDTMRIVALGEFNVIGSTTSSVSDSQLDSLIGKSLILGYDTDKPGQHAHRRIVDYFHGRFSIKALNWSLVNKADGSPAKDGGDLQSAEDLKKVLDKKTILW